MEKCGEEGECMGEGCEQMLRRGRCQRGSGWGRMRAHATEMLGVEGEVGDDGWIAFQIVI
jgi:hypothetical protein